MSLLASHVLRLVPTAGVVFLGLIAYGSWSLLVTVPAAAAWQFAFIVLTVPSGGARG